MELKLNAGDYVPDGCGGFLRQTGYDALLGQALFRLTCRRGSFPFLPELGSELWRLKSCKNGSLEAAALSYAAEAVFPMGLTVTQVRATPAAEGTIGLDIQLAYGNDTATVEVTV